MHVLSWYSYEHANILMVLSFDAYYYNSETLLFQFYAGPVMNMMIF
jgi:hypothetical protein